MARLPIASAKVRGFQGSDLASASRWPRRQALLRLGAVTGGREYAPVDISERTLREVHMPAFEAAVRGRRRVGHAGVYRSRGHPDDAHKELHRGWLRRGWASTALS